MSFLIYYLDDEADLLEIFVDLFTAADREILVFSSPEDLIQKVLVAPPHLLFLDYRLPNTTGDKVALLLDPAIPKALVTGDLTVHLVATFHEKFEKPFSYEKMEAFIQQLIIKKR